MAIDSRVDAVEKWHAEPGPSSFPWALTAAAAAFPHYALLLKFVDLIKSGLSTQGRQERAAQFLDILRDHENLLEAIGNGQTELKLKVEDLAEAVQVGLSRDAEAFNDAKRDRYVKIIGNAVRSADQIDDLAAFIRDVEMLGENDIKVLKVLNTVMNKATDWTPAGRAVIALHPNTFIQRSEEMAVQIAQALGQETDRSKQGGNPFSREEGYSICARLQGFGLAHEVPLSARVVPSSDYCFRLSKRGLTLLKLLGEHVENWEHYFPVS